MSAVHWMLITVVFSAAVWLPYVVERVVSRGLWSALDNPPADPPPAAGWAKCLAAAHRNAVENVPFFAAAVLGAAALGSADDATIVLCAQVYFASRVLYTLIYAAGIPVLRTLSFFTGWLALVAIVGLSLGAS